MFRGLAEIADQTILALLRVLLSVLVRALRWSWLELLLRALAAARLSLILTLAKVDKVDHILHLSSLLPLFLLNTIAYELAMFQIPFCVL